MNAWRVRVERFHGKRVPVLITGDGTQTFLTKGWSEDVFTIWLPDQIDMEAEYAR